VCSRGWSLASSKRARSWSSLVRSRRNCVQWRGRWWTRLARGEGLAPQRPLEEGRVVAWTVVAPAEWTSTPLARCVQP
jgi:hypothetical protein